MRGDVGLGGFFKEEGWVKICQAAFGGHGKDREAGASGEGDPQTNAFTVEGIRPRALKVRVGLNCASLLKIQQKLFFWMFQMPQIGSGVCWKEKKSTPFLLKLFASNISCVYWGANIKLSSWRISLTVSQHCMEDLRASIDHTSLALKAQVFHNRTLRNGQIWDSIESRQWGKQSIHFAQIILKDRGYWITLFSRYTSQHRD